MSHAATNWALRQKGLKPATKIVLLCLADCHNPEYGCFPSQERLADMAEMSERSVRTHLATLEDRGLIQREEGGRAGGTFRLTRYVLALGEEPGRRQILPPARTADPPPAEVAAHRRQNLPTNPVREPRNGTEAADARASPGDGLFDLVDRLVHELGLDRTGSWPRWWAGPDAPVTVSRWRSELLLDDDEIVAVAKANHRQFGEAPKGPRILNDHMVAYAQAKTLPLTPKAAGGPNNGWNRPYVDRRQAAADEAFERRLLTAARARSAPC